MTPFATAAVLIAAAMLYEFVNGFHDGANIVSTIIASHAMSARGALALAATASFAGPFFLGTAVSQTLGAETIRPEAATIAVAIAGMATAALWNLVTWWLRIPVSSSHALVGGVVGAAFAAAGPGAIVPSGLAVILVSLFAAPLVAYVAAYLVMQAAYALLRDATPRANIALSRAQIPTAVALAFANGANDAHKTGAIIGMGLVTLGFSAAFHVPWWVLALCAGALSAGTMAGGERIVRALASRFYRIRPLHGFASQAASAATILGISLAGGPVSSTQVASMAIVGAGAAERPLKVRWTALREIVVAWILTIPASALLAAPVHAGVEALLRWKAMA
jgi:PiT family inorganic phosphate transporter